VRVRLLARLVVGAVRVQRRRGRLAAR